MLATHCPACDRRTLLGPDRITALRSAEGRHDVRLRCRCGAEVRWTGGRPAAEVTSP